MLVLLPLLPLHCRQHCKLASAQSQSSRNMHWRHCQHCAVVVANVAPALSPLLRGRLCPCRAGVATLGTPMLPPASQTGICPVMTQLRPVVGEASLLHSTSSPVALSLYPESAHSKFGLQRSGQGSDGVFSALHWCPCLHRTGVIASVKLSLLLALRWRCCRVGLRRSDRCRAGICRCCAGVLRELPWHHCQHCAVILVAGVAPASLPSLRGHFCPCCAGIIALVAFASLPASRTGIYPVTTQSRHMLASLPALRHCYCRHCAGIVALVARAFLPSSCWHRCPWHTRVIASIMNWHPANHDAVATRCR